VPWGCRPEPCAGLGRCPCRGAEAGAVGSTDPPGHRLVRALGLCPVRPLRTAPRVPGTGRDRPACQEHPSTGAWAEAAAGLPGLSRNLFFHGKSTDFPPSPHGICFVRTISNFSFLPRCLALPARGRLFVPGEAAPGHPAPGKSSFCQRGKQQAQGLQGASPVPAALGVVSGFVCRWFWWCCLFSFPLSLLQL